MLSMLQRLLGLSVGCSKYRAPGWECVRRWEGRKGPDCEWPYLAAKELGLKYFGILEEGAIISRSVF